MGKKVIQVGIRSYRIEKVYSGTKGFDLQFIFLFRRSL